MASTLTRSVALLVVATIALIAFVAPRLGSAQDTEATPTMDETEVTALIATGQRIYETLCITCHRPGGAGATGSAGVAGIPALANNPFVALENPRPLLLTLINGRAGMPTFRDFSDEEIAGIASYVRQAFGNQAGPVDPALVAEVRTENFIDPPPPATPITTPAVVSDATPGSGTPSGGADPIPTPGQ